MSYQLMSCIIGEYMYLAGSVLLTLGQYIDEQRQDTTKEIVHSEKNKEKLFKVSMRPYRL